DEVLRTVQQLLRGETVNFEGRHVTMRDVTLDQPPTIVPPVIAGVRGPKSLAMAGRVCDGVVLADGVGPTYVRESIRHAGAPDNFRVSVFSALCLAPTAREAYELMTPYMSIQLTAQHPSIRAHPHFDEMVERFTTKGDGAIADFPGEWWTEMGAIGDHDAVLDHIEALGEAGVTDVALFPGPTLESAREDLGVVSKIKAALPR
ncbi:LLM class flavin-dependent oxidoreductase, partial [Ilumatobacter sp.]|uniref:LLM class flavin-dependent oxidoreductase n=1 Tax=Ilumatobacter sp. TaxID=1967498 RepID=UPI0037523F61